MTLYIICCLVALAGMIGSGMLTALGGLAWPIACLMWEAYIVTLAWAGWVIADRRRHLETGRRLYRFAERQTFNGNIT